MPGTPYPLGPFREGMNNIAEESTVEDTQVALALNLELDTDSSYKSRPAIIPDAETPVSGQNVTVLGYYVTTANATYLVCTTNSATWLYDIGAKTYAQIWETRASGFTQYDNKVVLISTSSAGGYWEAGTFTATPTMPQGENIVLYQDRLWAYGARGTANQNRVWFSNITTAGSSPTTIWTWTTATDFFEVKKGDGEWITHMVADTNALLIFRNRSTFRFTYPTSPFSGTLFEQNPTLGADNRWSVVPYESYYLVFSQGFLYQFINFQFYPLNTARIEFRPAATAAQVISGREIMVSVFGTRCIVWYYGSTFVYDIVSGTWSMWDSPVSRAAYFLQVPPTSLTGTTRTALAVHGLNSNAAGRRGVWRIIDDVLPAGGPSEAIPCVLRTKSYAFDDAAQYKRMFYWTMEVRTANGARGVAYPSAITTDGVTWDDMSLVTWDVLSEGSWDNPLIITPMYESDVSFPTSSPVRALIKCLQDSRLLRMYYEVYLECDGTTRTAPVRVYSITPYVRVKGSVSKQVS